MSLIPKTSDPLLTKSGTHKKIKHDTATQVPKSVADPHDTISGTQKSVADPPDQPNTTIETQSPAETMKTTKQH